MVAVGSLVPEDVTTMPVDTLDALLAALKEEAAVMLATVLAASGSTPAGVHARMLLTRECQASVGTVGGGQLEAFVIQEARRLFEEKKAAARSYHLDADHPESDMLCGGSVEILIEPLVQKDAVLLTLVQSARNAGKDVILARLVFDDGSVERRLIQHRGEGRELLQGLVAEDRLDDAERLVDESFERLAVRRLLLNGGALILEPIAGIPELVVFGGGHVGRHLVQLASRVGFRVVVVDDRQEYATTERFPEAQKSLVLAYPTALQHLTITPSTYIVIVTRGHTSDAQVLEQAVNTHAQYVGMIGSRLKVRSTYKRLAEHGISTDLLRRIHAPVGLDIGAITAEEIAVSIVAELISVRRGAMGVPSKSLADAIDMPRPESEK